MARIKGGMNAKKKHNRVLKLAKGDKELVRKGAVGEIVGRIYDKNGQTVDEDLKRKMVGISLDKIAKIPVRVGMSYGKDKIEAIKDAIADSISPLFR